MNEVPRAGDVDGQAWGMNKLFLNVADPGTPYGFRLVRAASWGVDRHLGFGRGVVSFDYDRDGRADLLVTGRSRPYLFRNTGSAFVDVSTTSGVFGAHLEGVDTADVDADGLTDIVGVRAPLVIWQENLGTRFAGPRTIKQLTKGFDVVVGDADGDSLADVYVQQSATTWNPADFVLLNRKGSWISLQAPAMGGIASDVEALRLRSSGTAMDFVVLNGGRDLRGPTVVLRLVLA